jgi:transposase
MTKRKKFTREFKEEAVKLLLNSDKSTQEIAETLGVHPNNLSRWKCLFLENPKKAFPGNGNRRDNDDEVYRLKKEVADLKMENEILKKSIAIFSREK